MRSWTSLFKSSREQNILENTSENAASVIKYVTVGFMASLAWAFLFALFGKEVEPGGQLFQLLALCLLGYICGQIISLIKLPPLLGMMLCGMVLTNIGLFNMTGVYLRVVSTVRDMSLTTILLMAGLDLDADELKRLSFVVAKLAFCPCLAEAGAVAVAAYFLLNMPWLWGLLLGFTLSAVSPAVVIPSLLKLKSKGYGENKGISTLAIAASSFDDILCISFFGILLGMIFSEGDLVQNILHGPIEAAVGLTAGIVWGFLGGYLPHRDENYLTAKRCFIIGGGGLAAVLLSNQYDYSGIGPLAVIVSSFIAAYHWKRQGWSNTHNPVMDFFEKFWIIMQPLLFGLMGTDIKFQYIDQMLILQGCGVLFFGLFFRTIACFIAMLGGKLNIKEILFINLSWLPKATIQATLGPIALDLATRRGLQDLIPLSRQLLTVAVLSILITAPIGAVGIAVGGRKLLTRADAMAVDNFKSNEIVAEETVIENGNHGTTTPL